MPVFDPTPLEMMFVNALGLIAVACLFVPVFRRLGLGAVLGYLAAGLTAQFFLPETLADHPEELLHFAEFGVVLFLFVIGLELRPTTLWAMRGDIFGLGMAQLLVTGAVLAIPALWLGLSPPAAIIAGLGLALSSTALVMQLLDERRHRSTLYGRKAFSILLFQDLAIVPLLLLAAVLAPAGETMSMGEGLSSLGFGFAAIGLLILAGRYLLDPMLRLLARSGLPEIMTASALGVVIAAGLWMDLFGLSYAMGAFLAGVMLASSSYRHEIEADIEPFRGLFLGLFFMAVGLSLDLHAVADNLLLIAAATPLAMALKAAAIYGVGRWFRLDHETTVRKALILPQHGEFGFVLFAAAAATGLFDADWAAVLVAVVTVSMALSPLATRLEPLFIGRPRTASIDEDFSDATAKILIVGFGRFGQIVAQPLFGGGFDVTIIDNDANRVREAERFGFRVHFGDGTRRDVLRSAGAAEARTIVLCIDDVEATIQAVNLIKDDFPQARLFVRSFDRRDAIRLMNLDVDVVVRETFESALAMGERVLTAQGLAQDAAKAIIGDIRARDLDRLAAQTQGVPHAGLDRLHTAPVRPEPLAHDPATSTPNEVRVT